MRDARPSRRVVTRGHVVRGACRFFLRHGTVDMDALAQDLAISRATLYRVVGSRDALLADVLWELADHLLERARRRRTRAGVDGVLEITRYFVGALRGSAPFEDFLRAEPETARRLLTGGCVHRRAVLAQRSILLEAGERDRLWPRSGIDDLAYLYVRVVESTLYAELLSSRRPDLALAERTARAVLQQTRGTSPRAS
ncbi:QsdR family transcriptional regulator [Streptomyces sp. NBC_00059]|uniref:QsdR family transcriptional regulator n=1 Tax=Streptomyces sp. NBC_00059 TaxID=2975635 RepID=UPI00225BF2EE|nr:QsdR family transcriptional regulator [Streptomyces sp. NBC_00059]MCX5417562.1 QsdR family transcriptional regulator [Streptomyces sp. NBC_00059]